MKTCIDAVSFFKQAELKNNYWAFTLDTPKEVRIKRLYNLVGYTIQVIKKFHTITIGVLNCDIQTLHHVRVQKSELIMDCNKRAFHIHIRNAFFLLS